MPADPRAGSNRLAYLDGVRGIASVYVVVSHSWDTALPYVGQHPRGLALWTAWLGLGRYAVTVFIVVSGFSLGLTYWRHGLSWPGGPTGFLRRRARRIVPPYWIAVALCSLIGATVLADRRHTLWDGAIPIRWTGVLTHLLFVQNVAWGGPAGSTAFWSIAIEVQIYLVFAACLVLFRRRRPPWLLVFTVLGVGAAVALSARDTALGAEVYGLQLNLYAAFLLGLVAARFAAQPPHVAAVAWPRWRTCAAWAGVVAVAVVLAGRHLAVFSTVNDLVVGPPVALVLSAVALGRLPVLARLLAARPVVWLGESSYSLYLMHAVVVEGVWRTMVSPLALPTAASLPLEILLATGLSVLLCRLFFVLCERPFITKPAARAPVRADRPTRGSTSAHRHLPDRPARPPTPTQQ